MYEETHPGTCSHMFDTHIRARHTHEETSPIPFKTATKRQVRLLGETEGSLIACINER